MGFKLISGTTCVYWTYIRSQPRPPVAHLCIPIRGSPPASIVNSDGHFRLRGHNETCISVNVWADLVRDCQVPKKATQRPSFLLVSHSGIPCRHQHDNAAKILAGVASQDKSCSSLPPQCPRPSLLGDEPEKAHNSTTNALSTAGDTTPSASAPQPRPTPPPPGASAFAAMAWLLPFSSMRVFLTTPFAGPAGKPRRRSCPRPFDSPAAVWKGRIGDPPPRLRSAPQRHL